MIGSSVQFICNGMPSEGIAAAVIRVNQRRQGCDIRPDSVSGVIVDINLLLVDRQLHRVGAFFDCYSKDTVLVGGSVLPGITVNIVGHRLICRRIPLLIQDLDPRLVGFRRIFICDVNPPSLHRIVVNGH